MITFASEFGVDMDGYDFTRYFEPEGCNPLWLLRPLRRGPSVTVTFGDLLEAAERGRWDRTTDPR